MNNENLETTADVINYIYSQKHVAKVRTLEFLEQPAIVVKVKLKIMARIRCIFSGDYRDRKLQGMQIDVRSRVNEDIPIHIIFVL